MRIVITAQIVEVESAETACCIAAAIKQRDRLTGV